MSRKQKRLGASKCQSVVSKFKQHKAQTIQKLDEAIANNQSVSGSTERILFKKERAIRKKTAPLSV